MRLLLLCAATAGALFGQTFEVVSVKPHPIEPGRFFFRMPTGRGLQVTGDRFTERMATLQDLVMEAYDVPDYRISGIADWGKGAEGVHFDIDAKAAKVPTVPELRQMLQALLADRFQLKLHSETKELPVYALAIAKTGSKMRELGPDEKPKTFATRPTTRPETLTSTIPMLIQFLSSSVDRPIVDQTGLTATYEYANLDWRALARDESIFAAIQQELGLRLEPRKDVVPVLVIDKMERPSGN